MRKRRALLLTMMPLWLCGCAEIGASLVESAFGDNADLLFTGEYRDRKEVERLGSVAEFKQKHGREPDLYWPEALSSHE